MLWILLVIILFGLLSKDDEELNAMAYVGSTEFNKAKTSMSEKDFKEYVKKNSKLMRKAESDAAEYYRKNTK